jgi:hypothetical protein
VSQDLSAEMVKEVGRAAAPFVLIAARLCVRQWLHAVFMARRMHPTRTMGELSNGSSTAKTSRFSSA